MNRLKQTRNFLKKTKTYLIDFISANKFISIFLSIYLILITIKVLGLYFGFSLYVFDYGIEHQVMHNTAYGRIMQSSYEVDNYLGDHFSPIVILFAPIYRIFPFGFTPLIFQTICMTISLLAIYVIAKKRLNSVLLASFITVLISIYPMIQGAVFFHYHPGTLAMPFFIWGIWALFEKNKFNLGFFLLAIASIGREEFGFAVGMAGIYHYFISKEKKSLLIFAYGFLISILAIKFIQPIFRPLDQNDSLARYGHLGNNILEIIMSPVTNTKEWFKMFSDRGRYDYFTKLFKIFAFIPLFSASIIIVAPLILLNMISGADVQRVGVFHYDSIVSLGIAYSFILSLEKIISWLKTYIASDSEKNKDKSIHFLTLKLVPIILILFIIPFGFKDLISENNVIPGVLAKPENISAYLDLQKVKKEIPKDAEVAVDGKAGAYFGDFPNTHYFPSCCGKKLDTDLVQYYVVYKIQVPYSDNNPQFFIDRADKIELIKETEFFKVYKRK